MKHVSFWLAILLALYVYARVNRYEFRESQDGFYVFDRWTTRIDSARLTEEHFVAEPRREPSPSGPIMWP